MDRRFAGNGMGESPSGETLLTQYGAADTGSVADVLIDDRIVLESLYGNRRTPLLSFGQLPTRLVALDLASCELPQDARHLGQDRRLATIENRLYLLNVAMPFLTPR
jgi:hypothetical protein